MRHPLPFFFLLLLACPACADSPRLWPGLPDSMRSGWSFTPSFEPDGQVAWFQYWADPLNVEEPQQILRVERVGGRWQEPQAVPIAPGRLVDWPLVTPEGNRLIVSVAERLGPREFDFDFYETGLPIERPVRLEKLAGADLNRSKTEANARLGVAANELGARMSDDGTLWFWSQREDATGSRDIFFARPGEDGYLAPEEFPGNTRYRESHPWISPDGRELIFASNRPGGLGEDDLWYTSRRDDGSWRAACRLPEPVNSVHDEELVARDPVTGRMLFTSDRPVDGETGYRVWDIAWPETFCPTGS